MYHGDEHLSGFTAATVGVVVTSRVYVVTQFSPYLHVSKRNDSEWKHILTQQHGDSKEKNDVTLKHVITLEHC